MRHITLLLAAFVLVSLATACSSGRRIISSRGVRVVVPRRWQQIHAANAGPVTDPRTLLVVGTAGVRPKASHCPIAAYRLPPTGAVVVVVGRKRLALSGAQSQTPGRWPLKRLNAVQRPSFECFGGRGVAATLVLGGRAYQVNVLAGDRASKRRVAQSLAIARSFDLVH
jgi:hypothetical protein